MSDLVNRLEALIAEVERRLEDGGDCDTLVAEINALSGCDYAEGDFFELHSWTSPREIAERAALGPAPGIPGITRAQILDSIAIVTSAEEPQATFHLELLEASLPHSEASGLLFHPHTELTDDQIVDEMLLRQHLFEAGGIAAVQVHLRSLAAAVMEDPARKPWSEQWARSLLGDNAGSA
jgi:hypothetical protein